METVDIVDLSNDVEIENARKKLDRKRFNEIKKYIPFLQYITANDPVKNEKYVKLLQWFNSNKNLPARVATTCEFAINKRFKTLKSSMVFPPHILSIFEGGGEAIDLVSDDDDQPSTSKNVNLISPDKQKNKSSNENSSKSINVTQKEKPIEEKQTNSSNKSTKTSNQSSTSSTKCSENYSITSGITIEEGEVLSDCENFVEDSHSISLSEISLNAPTTNKTKSSAITDDHDEKINQHLFDRIDDLNGDSEKQVVASQLSWKEQEIVDLNQCKKVPILKLKNVESLSRKSVQNVSNISDDDDVPRTRKKKHRHKKKDSEIENHQSEKQGLEVENSDCPQNHKKNHKKKKEKLKISRPLYVSDDDEDQSNRIENAQVESVKKPQTETESILESDHIIESVEPESELFTRRDLSKKETIHTESSVSDSNTVVLLDSDEDEINSLSKTNNQVESSTILEVTSSPKEIPVSLSEPIIDGKTTQSLLDSNKKVILPSPSKLKDLNTMGLNELNDIYAKLCEKTGIQLEELLGDLVSKSSMPTEDVSVTSIVDELITPRDGNYLNNKPCYNTQQEQFQEHRLKQQNLYNQQLLRYQQQQEFETHYQQQQQQQQQLQHQIQQKLQLQQQQEFQNHMHCSSNQIQNNPQVSYTYQNSLMPRLNLNDPRIVQKLKQIKDSPIHNLSIRESATLLMNCYTERPTYRPQPSVVKVCSNTATTYAEHKRLKELERKAKESKEIEKTKSTVVVQEDSSEAAAVSPKITSTNKKRKDSSGSESGKKSNKSKQNDKPTQNDSHLGNSGKTNENLKRSDSSDFEGGRKSHKSRSDTEEDEETIVMSFTGRPRSRQRIISSSSTLTNDSDVMQNDTPSLENKELNLQKVVQIVMSALGQTKEGLPQTPSKSRKNSARNSTDSTESGAKSPKPHSRPVEEELNKEEKKSAISKSGGKRKKGRQKPTDQLKKSPEKPKQPQPKRSCRELENLNCTFKEYSDIFEKLLLPTKDGKRLCSASGNSKNKPASSSSDSLNDKSKKTDDISDCDFNPSTSKVFRAAPIGLRRQTFSELKTPQNEKSKSPGHSECTFRRLSVKSNISIENKHDMESSDETDEFDIEEHRKIKNKLQETYKNINKDPFNRTLRVTLERLSSNEIMKWVKCEEVKPKSTVSSIPNLIAQKTKPREIIQNNIDKKTKYEEESMLVAINSKPVSSAKKNTPKAPEHLNNNISMTLNSTKTCAICNKRPFDLTNHYVVQHQTESYTSRLTSEEIENLEANITLAVRHRNRFKVTCAFCQVELEDNFVNFHAHFSYHTGEYGFKCAVCDLVKPYREDIRSHQYRTSGCLNGKIRSNYLYSPDLVVIYLYVCNLCNFVQLNEANIHKHQRDHHGFRFEMPQNVKKCILAAMDNGEILNEIMTADQEEEESPSTNEKDTQNVEQDFLNEHPLDIKDVLLTEQQFASTKQLAVFENLLQDINTDNEASVSTMAPSPQTSSEQLEAPSTKFALSNVMTVIHTASNEPCQESHKPYIESIDKKPELKNIKSGLGPDMQMMQKRMAYRQMPKVSNYFGMYKCTLNDCWFSTNEAADFVKHIAAVHNSAEQIFLDCAYCEYKSTKAHNIVGHIRTKHSMSRFQCAECTYRSTVPCNVAIHRKVYHKNSNSDKHIYECGSRLSQLDDKPADLIQKMVDNIASLKCPDCPESFYAISSMKTHIQKAHPLTFVKLDPTSFLYLACIHCKEESNSKDLMQMHLALDHPDEIGYVVERKLKTKSCNDAVENLVMIDISFPISPVDVHIDVIKDPGTIPSTKTNIADKTLIEDAPPSKVIKPNQEDITIVESVSNALPITQVPTITLTEEEKRLRPLLEILTENTGPPASSLYRCSECVASFLHFDLWRKHITVRHNIVHTVSCPYCSKQFSLELAAIHFESHRRHEYICFHCVTSFCSREKICEHFASFHQEFRTTIERKIAFGDVSFSIFKEKDVLFSAVDWLPLFKKLSDALRLQLKTKLQQNQRKEWEAGLSVNCQTELEDLEIPKYIVNGLPRYKCLVKSCPFVGTDEITLDVHMHAHQPPDKYKCSHCLIQQNHPTWEDIKNHKMLHKQEVHICCVCKFFHHSSSGISKHIERLHNFRDVPVISVWRNDINYKTSLAIVLTEKKMTFTSTDSCFCCLEVLKSRLVHHLKKEHRITLCPKCVICDEIILTDLDAEVHSQEHQSKPFKLKYEILTPFMYKTAVTSIVPFNLETRLIKEKRPSDDFSASTSKKVKPNAEVPIKIKEEVVIKTESPEIANEKPTLSASIKCVNLQNLMQNQTNFTHQSDISVNTVPPPAPANSQEIQWSVGQSYIPNYTVLSNNSGELMLPQNVSIQPKITFLHNPEELQFHHPNSTIHQSPTMLITALNELCIILPELTPICGNCNYECTDFANLKMHFATVHAVKNERFLFRITRKVECVHCCSKLSLYTFSGHHTTQHPAKMRLCRSVLDFSRCGICHEVFKSPPLATNIQLPICGCPRRQRLLADCLDLNTLKLLQDFGQNYFKYTCGICSTSFNQEQICKQHIVQVHKRATYPIVTRLEMMFVCFSCEKTSTSISNIIEHIQKVHFITLKEKTIDVISSIYRKIKIVYPKGLTICAGDLKSTRHCHDVEMFKQILQNSDKH